LDFRKLNKVETEFLLRGLATLPFFRSKKESSWLVGCTIRDFLYKLKEGGTRKEAFFIMHSS
jgi:hypothetical protein